MRTLGIHDYIKDKSLQIKKNIEENVCLTPFNLWKNTKIEKNAPYLEKRKDFWKMDLKFEITTLKIPYIDINIRLLNDYGLWQSAL